MPLPCCNRRTDQAQLLFMRRILRLHAMAVAAGGSRRALRLDSSRWDQEASAALVFCKIFSQATLGAAELTAKHGQLYIDGDYNQLLESMVSQTLVLREGQFSWVDNDLAKDFGYSNSNPGLDVVVVDRQLAESAQRTEQECDT